MHALLLLLRPLITQCSPAADVQLQWQVLGAMLLPHGAVLLDPGSYIGQSPSERTAADRLYHGGQQAAQLLQQLRPDLILLVTPHGIAHDNNLVLYHHPTAVGTQRAGTNERHSFTANINIDMSMTAALMDHLVANAQNVSLLEATPGGWASPAAAAGGAPDELAIQLGWGEVVPWAALGNPITPSVILATPAPTGSDTSMVGDLLLLGQLLGEYFSASGAPRTLMLISADLAHTHSHAEGPGNTTTTRQHSQTRTVHQDTTGTHHRDTC